MRTTTRVVIPTTLATVLIFASTSAAFNEATIIEREPIANIETLKPDIELEPLEKVPEIATHDIIAVAEVMDIQVEEYMLPKEDMELIALVTMAEAEGECEEGKRLVIDTILNRVDHPAFPNTVYEVVYQKNQFTSMWNGRVDECELRDDIYNLVLEELEDRTNEDVCFFRTDYYSEYGTPLFQVGNHYFSSMN